MERWGTNVPGRTQDRGRCMSWTEDRPVGSVIQNQGTVAPETHEEHHESGAAQPKPPPPPSSSWGRSSVVNEATAENLSSGIEELMSQQAQNNGSYSMARRGGVRSGRRDVGGKPRTYGESPHNMVGPTGGPGRGVDEEARTEAKGTHQVGKNRGGRSDSIQHLGQPRVCPQPPPRSR